MRGSIAKCHVAQVCLTSCGVRWRLIPAARIADAQTALICPGYLGGSPDPPAAHDYVDLRHVDAICTRYQPVAKAGPRRRGRRRPRGHALVKLALRCSRCGGTDCRIIVTGQSCPGRRHDPRQSEVCPLEQRNWKVKSCLLQCNNHARQPCHRDPVSASPAYPKSSLFSRNIFANSTQVRRFAHLLLTETSFSTRKRSGRGAEALKAVAAMAARPSAAVLVGTYIHLWPGPPPDCPPAPGRARASPPRSSSDPETLS